MLHSDTNIKTLSSYRFRALENIGLVQWLTQPHDKAPHGMSDQQGDKVHDKNCEVIELLFIIIVAAQMISCWQRNQNTHSARKRKRIVKQLELCVVIMKHVRMEFISITFYQKYQSHNPKCTKTGNTEKNLQGNYCVYGKQID